MQQPIIEYNDFTTHVGEIIGTTRIVQSFSVAQEFSQIDIMFATFMRKNTKDIVIHLKDDLNVTRDIAFEKINCTKLQDNGWHCFRFEQINPSKKQSYYLIIESPDSIQGDAVTVRASKSSFVGGGLSINGKKTRQNLAFKVFQKYLFQDAHDVRYEISRIFLKGRGIEIGAGAFPQLLPDGVICEYFDKRSQAELAQLFQMNEAEILNVYSLDVFEEHFPDGADFLIAHNVLEHTSNPIKTLIEWHSYVKSEGIVVISVPDANYCPDRGRLIPPFEHLLWDYLLERDDDSFESREHIYSFIMGWIDDGFAKGMDKFNIAKRAHECAHAAKNDLHWHAFNEELLKNIITAAALFSNQAITIERTACPDKESIYQTIGDIIYVYRITNYHSYRDDDLRVITTINNLKKQLIKAQSLLKSIAR